MTLLVFLEVFLALTGITLAALATIISVIAFWGRARIKRIAADTAKSEVEKFLAEQAPALFRQTARQEANEMFTDLHQQQGGNDELS